MRRVSHLINDIRFNSNQIDTNRFTDLRLVKFFNDAQRAIQAVIFSSDTGSTIFEKVELSNVVAQQEEYDLPVDVYAESSVNAVKRAIGTTNVGGNQYYTPLRKITNKENRNQLGYILQGRKLLLSPVPQNSEVSGLQIFYTRSLPTLSPRVGQIDSIISGTSITLKAGYSSEAIGNFDDHITVVAADGTIKQSGIGFTSYAGGVISSPTVLTDVAANDYVVLGKYATSHPDIPSEAEGLLTTYVERKIFAVDSSPDIADSDMFTKEETQLIITLFEKKDHDVKYPPIVDGTYINY